tara:strand:- start:325 stop:2064 length:1740 start_codon:yes stop_codon:yes gene_type:complete
MKTILLFLLLSVISLVSIDAQTYQKSVSSNDQRHFHDLNTEPANDGTGDYFVAGNLFDSSMQIYTPFIKRLDNTGNVIWLKTYTSSLPNARIFDIQPYRILGLPNEVAITGSIDVGGVKNVFIAKIDAVTGALVGAKNYAIPSPNLNSIGLHISYVFNDANGDGINEEGFVVGGFYSDSYNLSTTARNTGFVLRVYSTLGVFWVAEVNSASTNQDFDAVNSITETNDGYFLTGSTNHVATSQFSILAQKIDFQGTMIWNRSHVFGNSQDVSVDAYFDTASQQIYMLSNYSVTHLFGVTVLDNVTGAISFPQSWYAVANELNRYGFTIMESRQNPNNLVITGYDRDENWTASGSNYFGQSNLFVYEFDKSNGNPIATNYQYLVQHSEPSGDEFNFWNGQMPFIFYPDISFGAINAAGEANYYHVGYKTDPAINFTEADLFKTPVNKVNECDQIDLSINVNPVNFDPVEVITALTSYIDDNLPFNATDLPYIISDCATTLTIIDNNLEEGSLYPNPANDYVFTTARDASTYSLYDNLGRNIMSGTLLNNRSVYIGDLPKGMYIISIANEQGTRSTYKLIKE